MQVCTYIPSADATPFSSGKIRSRGKLAGKVLILSANTISPHTSIELPSSSSVTLELRAITTGFTEINNLGIKFNYDFVVLVANYISVEVVIQTVITKDSRQ